MAIHVCMYARCLIISDGRIALSQVKQRLEAMQEAMKSPQVQQQMAEMQSAMANPALQERLESLKDDPELQV